MIKDDKMHCKICGKKSHRKNICKDCDYFLKHGATEEAIKSMLADTRSQKIWKEDEKIAHELADAYYNSTIENYKISSNKDSKENFGYNTFIDGIKVGLDIIMPMLNDEYQKIIKEKINNMIEIRNKKDKSKF